MAIRRNQQSACQFLLLPFGKAKRVTSPFLSLTAKPNNSGKPTPARPLRPVCPQANVTRNTRIVCCVSFGSCVPWWLKILATTRTRHPDSLQKAQQEAGPGITVALQASVTAASRQMDLSLILPADLCSLDLTSAMLPAEIQCDSQSVLNSYKHLLLLTRP